MDKNTRVLVLTDLEPDDMCVLKWLAEDGYECDVVVGHGNVQIKAQWMNCLKESVPEMKNWKVLPGMETKESIFPIPNFAVEKAEIGSFDPKEFEQIVRDHPVIISIKPMLELLSLDKDLVFPDHVVYATMSFNLRSTIKHTHGPKAPYHALTENSERILKMFPNGFHWIESFPALGGAGGAPNAGNFAFKNLVIRNIQLQWNEALLMDITNKLRKGMDEEGYDSSKSIEELGEELRAMDLSLLPKEKVIVITGLIRSIKAYTQIKADVKTNSLIVDPLVVAIATMPGTFVVTRALYKGHDPSGYPQFEDSPDGNVFIFKGDEKTGPELAKVVSNRMMQM